MYVRTFPGVSVVEGLHWQLQVFISIDADY